MDSIYQNLLFTGLGAAIGFGSAFLGTVISDYRRQLEAERQVLFELYGDIHLHVLLDGHNNAAEIYGKDKRQCRADLLRHATSLRTKRNREIQVALFGLKKMDSTQINDLTELIWKRLDMPELTHENWQFFNSVGER